MNDEAMMEWGKHIKYMEQHNKAPNLVPFYHHS